MKLDEFEFEDVTKKRKMIENELAKFGFSLFELRVLEHAGDDPATQAERRRINQRLERSITNLVMLGYNFKVANFVTVWSKTKTEAHRMYHEMKGRDHGKDM